MKKLLIYLLVLVSPVAAQAAVTQLNALSWARADGTDQTVNMQRAVNAAATAGQSLFVPPGIVYTAASLTNTANVLIEDYTDLGQKTLRGALEIVSPPLVATTNYWGGTNVTQIAEGEAYLGTVIDRSDVRWYGAVANDSLDDLAAFQEAVDTGKPVYVPEGTYNLSAAVTLSSGSTIFGDGPAKTIIQVDSASQSAFKTGSASTITYVFVKDLALKTTLASTVPAIDFSGISDSVVENVRVTTDVFPSTTHGFQEGLRCYTTNGWTSYRNRIYNLNVYSRQDTNAFGIYCFGSDTNYAANSTFIYGGSMSCPGGRGVNIWGGTQYLIQGVTFENGTWTGVRADWVKGALIQGCRFESVSALWPGGVGWAIVFDEHTTESTEIGNDLHSWTGDGYVVDLNYANNVLSGFTGYRQRLKTTQIISPADYQLILASNDASTNRVTFRASTNSIVYVEMPPGGFIWSGGRHNAETLRLSKDGDFQIRLYSPTANKETLFYQSSDGRFYLDHTDAGATNRFKGVTELEPPSGGYALRLLGGTNSATIHVGPDGTGNAYFTLYDTNQVFGFNAALAIGSRATDPAGPADGTIWYNSATHEYRGRTNGVTVIFSVTPAP